LYFISWKGTNTKNTEIQKSTRKKSEIERNLEILNIKKSKPQNRVKKILKKVK